MLVTALSTVYQWFPLGIHLGLSYSRLKVIETSEMRQVEMCKINMLAVWLNGPEKQRTKKFLQDALNQLNQSPQLLSSQSPTSTPAGESRMHTVVPRCPTAQPTSDSLVQSSITSGNPGNIYLYLSRPVNYVFSQLLPETSTSSS